jgi:tetratricopeptide (TPR) repeat protein
LINRWQANYVATMVLADAQGRAFWKSTRGSSELERWNSPQEFLAALEKQRKIRVERDRRLALAEYIPGDLNKAAYLEKALQGVPVYAAVDYQDIYARIYELDRENRLGLRARYFALGLASRREKLRRLLELRRWKEALSECNSLLESVTVARQTGLDERTAFGQTETSLYLDRGHAYLGLGQFDRAAVDLARGQALPGGNLEHALLQVYALVQLGDAPGYRRVCADLLKRYRDTPNAWHAFLVAWTCGMAPDSVDDWSGVIALVEKSIHSAAFSHLSWNALGLLQYRAGNYAEAEKALRRSLAAAPNWRGRNELILALVEQRRNNPKQAREWLNRFLSAPVPAEDALSGYDFAKLHATGYRDALVYQQLVEEAVVLVEGPPVEAFSALGARRYRGFMHLGQWDQALAVLNQAITGDPGNALLYLERGRCHEGLNQQAKAVADFETALKLKSGALDKARARFESGAKAYSDRQTLDDACRDVAQIQQRLGRKLDVALTLGYLGSVWQGHAGWLFEAARAMATLVPRPDGDPAHLTPEQRERGRRVAELSISLLKQALEAGFLDSGRILNDGVFQPLAGRDDYWALCTEMYVRSTFSTAGATALPFAEGNPPPALSRQERGRFFGRRGKWRQAVAEYDLALQEQPGQPETWLERGRCHAMLKEWEQTATDFVKALDLSPQGSGFFSPRSRICKELAHWEQAFGKAVQLRPRDAQLRVGRARFYHLRGQWREAAAVFSEAIEAHPLWEEWFEAAATLSLAGQQEAQRKLLTELIRRAGPEPHPFVAFVLARSCSLLPNPPADPAQVIRWADRAAAPQPNAGHYVHALGMAQYRAGNLEQAVQTLQRSMNTGWQPYLNQFFLAMAHHHLGHAEEARKYLDMARAQLDQARPPLAGQPTRMFEPDWLEANVISREAEKLLNAPHRREAEDCVRQGRWAEAITHLDALLQKDPGFWPDRKQRGEAHARLGHWSQAAADYARVLEQQPHNPVLWFENACLQCQLEDNPGYQKLCSRMDERFGRSKAIDDAVFLAHGCVLAPGALGDPAEVVKRAKQRLALTAPPNPHNAFSVHVLGLAYYRAGQYGEAAECLSKDPGPQDVEAIKVLDWLVLAMAEAKRDRAASARQWFDRANKWLEEKTREMPAGGPVVPAGWLWRDWVLVQTLHREAQRVVADRQ